MTLMYMEKITKRNEIKKKKKHNDQYKTSDFERNHLLESNVRMKLQKVKRTNAGPQVLYELNRPHFLVLIYAVVITRFRSLCSSSEECRSA